MWLFTVILFISAAIPGILILNKPEIHKLTLRYWLVFAGSYIFSVTIVHLIPELFVHTDQPFQIAIFILLGFFMQIALDYLTSGIEHGHTHHHHRMPVYSLMIGLVIHALMDGSILVHPTSHMHSTEEDLHGLSVLVGIVLHKIPAAIVLASVLAGALQRRWKMMIFLMVFAISSPVGLWAGNYLHASGLFGGDSLNILFAIVSGNFLHISTTIYFESSPQHSFDHKKLLYALMGAALAVLVELVHH